MKALEEKFLIWRDLPLVCVGYFSSLIGPTMVTFNIFRSKINLEKIRTHEIEQKERISRQDPANGEYLEKRISTTLAITLMLSFPLFLIDLLLKTKYSFFFVNTLRNDLTIYLLQNLKPSLHISRFSLIKSKLFLLPLRIYSRTIRQEWTYNKDIIRKSIDYLCSKYIILFINLMRGKIFFVRDDYHAEPSFLTSISLEIPDIVVVSFQHGSMDLSFIKKVKIYPGQRAGLQIAHDKFTANTFLQSNYFNSKVIWAAPCYNLINVDYTRGVDLVFIGNCSSYFLDFSELLAAIVEDCTFINDCYYKPHPSEKIIMPRNLKLMDQVDDYTLIADCLPKIFIGASSTVLYDAAMAGYKIILVSSKGLCTLDSLANLADFPTITSVSSAAEIIHSTYLSNEILHLPEDTADYDFLVDQIKLLHQNSNHPPRARH